MIKTGITAGGNWIVDKTKIIDDFPPQDGLANIMEESQANGGAPYNVLKDLFKLGAGFPLKGVGVIGNDGNGNYILNDCANHQIDASLISQSEYESTSYTDVMTSRATGRRTFFHCRGANAHLDISYFPVDKFNCRIFHLGYLLLLDKLDELVSDNQTKASFLLQAIQEKGIKTSIDIVSENSDRFKTIVPPSLPYVNYLFVNEFEASKITGIKIIEEQKPNKQAMVEAAFCLLEMGVNDCVFLHTENGAIAVDKDREITSQGKVEFPKTQIKGAAGAGDAFAAGVLYGIHENFDIKRTLELGVCAAASSLAAPTCSDAVLPVKECFELGKKLGFSPF